MDFIAAEVLGGEDLHVAKAVADGVFAEAARHEREDSRRPGEGP